MDGKSVFVLSLGCSRNTVDSETMIAILERAGHRIVHQPQDADVFLVNSCAFIEEAKRETVDTVLTLARYKKDTSRLIVAGCFPQLYSREVLNGIPEVDAVIGIGNLSLILDATESQDKKDYPQSRLIGNHYREYPKRKTLTTLPGYAYLKVSEGCSGSCSFCLIPFIKGPMRSRAIDAIVKDANGLHEMGTKEIVLTSQDTLAYGRDLGMKNGIRTLMRALLEGTDVERIRLLYLSPHEELMKAIDLFEDERVLPYFDLPVQHVSPKLLQSMHRYGSRGYFRNIISRIRKRFPHAVFRTTVIVGYPGEKKADFAELLDFVGEVRFNHLGVFVFSSQRETEASRLKGRVKQSTAEKRQKIIIDLQRRISGALLQKEVGNVLTVLVEERIADSDLYFGRSYHFAPEVDGTFVVRSSREIEPGTVIQALVTRADDYDLHGTVMEPKR
jgi:ribosomal protein S12 methylthiotransferase